MVPVQLIHASHDPLHYLWFTVWTYPRLESTKWIARGVYPNQRVGNVRSYFVQFHERICRVPQPIALFPKAVFSPNSRDAFGKMPIYLRRRAVHGNSKFHRALPAGQVQGCPRSCLSKHGIFRVGTFKLQKKPHSPEQRSSNFVSAIIRSHQRPVLPSADGYPAACRSRRSIHSSTLSVPAPRAAI